MLHDPEPTTTSSARLTREELADLVGDPVERVQDLTARGVLQPDDAGHYSPGDAHRVRVIDGFEAAGVPLDVLVRAQAAGIISVAYYDQLHIAPGRPSNRGYETFKPDVVEAVEVAIDVLDRLGPSDLPPGHVGVADGPIVARDGDIFGRTVNLAARISDVAPSGELYIPASTGQALPGRFVVMPAGTATLQGVGTIDLARVLRPGATID